MQAYASTLATERNLPLDQVLDILAQAHHNDTVARLIGPTPAGKKVWRSWQTYRDRFVEPTRIRMGVEFYNENQAVLARASQRFGVPASIITAIIGVETLYGRDMGNFRVLDALRTLAFDYPDPNKPERAAMFRNQLSDFITLSLQNKLDAQVKGSYAGAIGLPQFMPGSIMRYAIDGDGDGRIDLQHSTPDAVMSVANFLVEHGWVRDLPVFAPVVLPGDPAALVDGGLTPTLGWPALQQAKARLTRSDAGDAWRTQPLGVIDLAEERRGTVQYRTATPNFFALTQYNRSYFYATAVADLATEINAHVQP